MMATEKAPTSFRLDPQTHERLSELKDRWHVAKPLILDSAVALLADPALGASLGTDCGSLEQGARAWADLLDQAATDNAQTFGRAEWNYLADVNNGCSPLFTLHGEGVRLGVTMLWANAHDGHRLDRTGDKWFPEGRKADQAVTALVNKLRQLDYVHGWAVVVAIQFFWAHCNELDHQKDEWWTTARRRQVTGAAKAE